MSSWRCSGGVVGKARVWTDPCPELVCGYLAHRKCVTGALMDSVHVCTGSKAAEQAARRGRRRGCVPRATQGCCLRRRRARPLLTLAARSTKQKHTATALVQRLRKMVTGSKVRYVTDEFDVDLTYITPRLLAMSFPAAGSEAMYRNNIREVAALLHKMHGDEYLVFNLCEKKYDIKHFKCQVLEFGWPDHCAPPLERLCTIVQTLDSWLRTSDTAVAVVHCKGGKGRTGVVVAAYMLYARLFEDAEVR